MRVKITLLPPLPSQRFLFPVPDNVKFVSEFKKHLVRSLSAVAQHVSSAKELILEIDGFELLNGSELDILEATDVVSVRLAPSSSEMLVPKLEDDAGRKRKAVSAEKEKKVGKSKKRKVECTGAPKAQPLDLAAPVPVPPPASTPAPVAVSARTRSASSASSSSASSSSSSSSSSATTSSSSSSSSSSSDSDSDTSSSKTPLKPQPAADPFPVLSQHPASSQPPVPPGQGKNETQNRNARRRLARQYKKAQAEAEAEASLSSLPPTSSGTAAPTIPNGHAPTGVTTRTTPSLPLPRDMANRNKKRGFRKDMAAVQGTKIVFDGEEASTSGAVPSGSGPVHKTAYESTAEASQGDWTLNGLPYGDPDDTLPGFSTSTPRKARVVPPSEMTDLPSNIFVTRADFGEPWTKKKKGGRKGEGYGYGGEYQEESGAQGGGEELEGETAKEQGVNAGGQETYVSDGEAPWGRVEAEFSGLKVLKAEDILGLRNGTLLAYQELELDLYTFSPVLKVHIAKVVASEGGNVTVEEVQRPVEDEEQEFGEASDDGPARTVITVGEVAEGKWRLV